GDLAAYETAIAGLEGEGEKLRRALLSGAATEALAVIEGMANPSAGDYLLLALSSRRTEPEVAQRALDTAIERLKGEGHEESLLARALEAPEAPGRGAEVTVLALEPELKAAGLAVLSQRGGPAARELAELARRLSSAPGFLKLYLERILSG
ncbi:MAG: hypothetical protein KDD47_14325, partial [Acidobacteria bacterium]|nr:hypothetical protein [Acidobacteriota bacterium]